jgi:hypothetical protein
MSCVISSQHHNSHQTRTTPPTLDEDLLGDSVERAYSQGLHQAAGLVSYLNQCGPAAPNGVTRTEQMFAAEMKRLGA